jgi:hypothetical protein
MVASLCNLPTELISSKGNNVFIEKPFEMPKFGTRSIGRAEPKFNGADRINDGRR